MNDIEIIKQVIYTEKGEKMSYIDIDNIIDNECENFIQAIENLIQRNKDLEQEHKEENGRLRDKIKELEEIANWHIEHLTEDIADYIDDDKVGNASIIGDFKEEREHWRDINRILNNKKTYIDYKNY